MSDQASVLSLITPKLKDLTLPFPADDIEWRVQRAGITNARPWALVLAYVDARAVQNRLDDVVGPENWTVKYEHIDGGVMCNLSIRCNGEWVTKSDGSPETAIEAFKGGISKALVRAASVWGIGRYLYRLTDSFASFADKRSDGAREVRIDGQYFYWIPPELPTWALPAGEAKKVKSKRSQIPANELSTLSEINAEVPSEKSGAEVNEDKDAIAVLSKYFKPEDDDFVGGYIVNFGKKHFGKHLSDMEVPEIEGYRDWLIEDSKKSGKPLSGKAADFVEAAQAYLNNFRSEQKDASDEIPF